MSIIMINRMMCYLYVLLSISSMIQSFRIYRQYNSIQHTHHKHQSSLSLQKLSSPSLMLNKKRYSFQFNYKTFDEFLGISIYYNIYIYSLLWYCTYLILWNDWVLYSTSSYNNICPIYHHNHTHHHHTYFN